MTDLMICGVCGGLHPKEAIELTFRLPDVVFELSDEERTRRCNMGTSLCVLDHSRFFVRGLLPLPVHGQALPYRIAIWAEVDEQTFADIYHLWDAPNQAEYPPTPATLANNVPTVPATRGMTITIRLTGPKTRPEFFLADSDHPLAREQSCGIVAHRALEYTQQTERSDAG